METFLVLLLIGAVIYIIYLERQPKTDKERKAAEAMRERMTKTKEIQARKNSQD